MWLARNDFRFRSLQPGTIPVIESLKARVKFHLTVFFKHQRTAHGSRFFTHRWGANGVIASFAGGNLTFVRLTFDDPETCSTVLKDGLDLGDVTVQLFAADDRVHLVHLRDLPVEVDHDNVSTFFSAYGEVLSIDHCYFEKYPSVRNGNRIVKILLTQDIPCFVEVEGCNCRVWYPRQPAQCLICREFGHRAPACPLSGRC